MSVAKTTPPRSRLRQLVIRGRSVMLHSECIEGFRADRGTGLIYGPYKVQDPETGRPRFARDAEEASMIDQFCPYCGEY